MSKIKVVQIENNRVVDSKGRIWLMPYIDMFSGKGIGWRLIELPDEPLTKQEE